MKRAKVVAKLCIKSGKPKYIAQPSLFFFNYTAFCYLYKVEEGLWLKSQKTYQELKSSVLVENSIHDLFFF